MDITHLKQIIETALQSSPFTVSGGLLQSNPITTLFTNFFTNDSFVLSGATKQGENATSITVQGQMTQSLVGLPSLHAAATFSVVDSTAQVHMVIDGLPQDWTFTSTFTSVKGSVFDQFTWTEPLLTLDSTAQPPLPDKFPQGFGYPPYSNAITAAMTPGLGIIANVALTTSGGPLDWLLSGNSWQVTGPIVLPQAQLSVALATAPQPGVQIGSLSIPFSLNLVAAALQPDPAQPIVVTTAFQLNAEVDKDVGDGKTIKIPLMLRESSTTAPTLTIESDMAMGEGISVEEIAALIGSSISGQVPPDFPALDQIQVEGMSLIVAPLATDQKLISLGATIGWVVPKPYSVFDGLISFNGMAVTFTYIPGGYDHNGAVWYVTTGVAAEATVAGGVLDAEIQLPDLTFSCNLKEDTSIDIKQIVTRAVGESISMPQINVTALSLFGDITDNIYRFQATVTDDWVFHIGSTPLALSEIDMDITKDLTGFSGEIACKFRIAKTDMYGRASYDAQTGGWAFQVGTTLAANVSLTDLAADVLALFGINLPDNAPQLTLTALNFSFDTATHNFDFQCATTLTIADSEVDMGLEIGTGLFKGYVWVKDSYFEVDFQSANQKNILTASWQATDEQAYLEFGDIANALGLPKPDLPDGLDLRLTAASLSYDFTDKMLIVTANSLTYGKAIFVSNASTGSTVFFASLAVGHPISISNLPLLGSLLSSKDTAAIDDLAVIVSSGDISQAQATAINQVIQDTHPGYPLLPATGTASPVGISATLDFGGNKIPISLGMGNVAQNGGQSNAANTIVGPQSGDSGAVTTTPPAKSDGTAWFNIQKSFGPVSFDKMGVRYNEGVLWFLLNASISVGGVSLSLQGASIGSPLTSFSPRFDLQGLGIDFKRPPLEIGGGFAKVPPSGGASFEYDGAVVVKLPEWGLTAYGSYAEIDGKPSMFIFVQVDGTFGGPPAFFVTGVVGGFGYNSSVRIPGEAEVIDFPLVGGLTNPLLIGGKDATPLQALTALTGGPNPWVAHTLGEYWIAAGLLFTTYELLKSTALLVVEFGLDLTIALLGISTARFPPEPSEGPAYAQIQLQLEALLKPNQGFFGISANLTRNSFLIDRSCVLTGGFAFYLWFSPSEHAGDFVVTLGGYNPNFDPPKHYPLEPKVGFSWTLDSTVSVSGNAYFALTPSAAMAGGALAIKFHDGNLSAWFTAYADLIVWWRPFHFIADIGVSIGVSYKMDMGFTSTTINVELGADLTLWGPPTGGIAHVHLWCISFTVNFGAAQSSNTGPLQHWTDFTPLLPAAGDVIKFTPVSGLAAQPTDIKGTGAAKLMGAAPVEKWVVRSGDFSFTNRSAVPSSELFVGSQSSTPYKTGDKLDIRPMQKEQLASTQRLSMTLDGLEIDLLGQGWGVEAIEANVPKALWGKGAGSKLDPGNDQMVLHQLVGFSLQAPKPQLGWSAGPINVADSLSYDPLEPPGIMPIKSGTQPSGDIPVAGTNTIQVIQDQIATSAVTSRNQIYTDLENLGIAVGANGPLTTFAANAGRLFVAEPLIVPPAPPKEGA